MKADQDRAADARARAQAVKEESAQANEALKEYKRQQEKVAAEQEVARIAYLERKDRLAVEHKERAAAIAAEKEARRKAMVCFTYSHSLVRAARTQLRIRPDNKAYTI